MTDVPRTHSNDSPRRTSVRDGTAPHAARAHPSRRGQSPPLADDAGANQRHRQPTTDDHRLTSWELVMYCCGVVEVATALADVVLATVGTHTPQHSYAILPAFIVGYVYLRLLRRYSAP